MRFSCDKCQAKYNIADEKVRGKVVAVKCNKCGNKITVNGKALDAPPPEEPAEERTRMVALADMDQLRQQAIDGGAAAPAPAAPPPPAAPAPKAAAIPEGFYALVGGEQQGPLSGADFARMVKSAAITADTFCWRDGMADWKKASDIGELAPAFATAAPPPPRPAPAALFDNDGEPATAVASKEALAALRAAAGIDSDGDAPAPSAPEPEPEPAPAPARPAAAKPAKKEPASAVATGPETPAPSAQSSDLHALFDHDDLAHEPPQQDLADSIAGDLEQKARQPGRSEPAADPFAAVSGNNPDVAQPAIGEQTRFFMQQAGVTKRNPPWKIALFVLGGLGLPVALLYALSSMHIVPLNVTTVDEATGEVVERPIFSSEGVGGLRDLLLGKNKKAAVVAKAGDPTKPKAVRKTDDDKPLIEKKKTDPGVTAAQAAAAQALFEEHGAGDKTLKVRDNSDKQALDTAAAGLSPKVIQEVFAKNLSAFNGCTENELRRNPGFKGGKIMITFTIGASGTVSKAGIDKQDVDQSDLGRCIKDKARRVVFPQFEGDAFDVEIPLVLANGG